MVDIRNPSIFAKKLVWGLTNTIACGIIKAYNTTTLKD
jgi:hypothetical protein